MNDHERLIEVIKNSLKKNIGKSCQLAENIADDLLEHGVIVPPCKVGDTVYKLSGGEVLEYEVFEIRFDGDVMQFWSYNEEYANFHKKFIFDSMTIGKTVFLTREEAEEALKGE